MEIKTKSTSEYKSVSIEETFHSLESATQGLSEFEARKRLEIYGYNEIQEGKKNYLLEFFMRYWGPMPWLLELAMALSFALRHYLEGMMIFVLLTVNAIIGYMHSRSSQRAVEILKKKLALQAKVLRDEKWVIKGAKEIVPGDIIAIKLGDIVPADAQIISGEVSIDESALTGESLPVEAHLSDVVHSSSIVKQGESRCIVLNTGANTYFAKTAELVKIAEPKSQQEEVMMAIVRYMMYLGIAAAILVSIDALLLKANTLVILTFVVIFLMGAIPVALPAVLTIVQAVGALELAKKGSLVTKLDSIEDAASIDVLCLDKTGTITQNKLSVVDSVPVPGYEREEVITLAALASQEEGMDAIDLAVIAYAKSMSVNFGAYEQIQYTPFSPASKKTEAIIQSGGKRFKLVKGAAQVITALCRESDKELLKEVDRTLEEFSRKGYRAIAIARSEDDDFDNFRLAGFLPMADPPRPDAKSIIEEAKKLGIKAIMLTGDNLAIAKEVARQVGIGSKIIRFKDIEGLSEEEQGRIIDENDGFAEIYPEDKYKIVKHLQARGHMVGMTGDGVNDAPALKQAEMGIAVNNSTDVAKASASVVLTEPGISVIIDAVTISRKTYQRMLTWVINKVTKVIEFVVLLTVSFFWLHNIVLSLLGMALLIFANDFVTMSLATDNVAYTSNPNHWKVKDITLASLIPGMLFVAEGIIVIWVGINYFQLEWEKLGTLVMLNLVFNSQFRVLIVRERRHFWSSLPGSGLMILSIATITGFIFLGLSNLLVPSLSLYQTLAILGISAFFALCIDFPKYFLFRKFRL